MDVSVVAYLALILFVPFSIAVYAMVRPTLATAIVLVSAVLFLPELVKVDPPGLPPFDKATIAGLCALVCSFFTAGKWLGRARPGRGVDFFAWLVVLGAFGTVMTNRDVLTYGPTSLRALTTYDAVSDAIQSFLYLIFPFFLGRALYRTAKDLEDLMGVVVVLALAYSPLVIIELVMSPQLNRWIYGFHQHMFAQTMRDGGFRPMVFMAHGLALAMFLLTAALFAADLARAKRRLPFGVPAAPASIFLALLLLVCHSAGAAIYLVVCLPFVFVGSPKFLTRAAAALGVVVLLYPALRAADAFPVRSLVDAASHLSQDRAQSLEFRFDNETLLVKKALERAVFGWGGFQRARIFSPWGQDISVTDGQWIIAFGDAGVVGFIGLFGMLLGPVFSALSRLKRIAGSQERVLVSGMSLVTALNVLDLLPNGLYSALPLFYAGALAGVSRGLSLAPRYDEREFE